MREQPFVAFATYTFAINPESRPDPKGECPVLKTCTVCGEDKEGVSTFQVAPATWNGFNNFANACVECQSSKRFLTGVKAAAPKKRTAAQAAAAAAAAATEEKPTGPTLQISHRRTGAVLHTVEGQSLAQSELIGLALVGADLQHAAMRGANLQKSDLRMADLAGADLRGADLRGVDLRGADLRGADLREARLHRAVLGEALYDLGTLWPADFDPHSSGARKQPRSG